MRKQKTSTLTEDILKMDQALMTSLKGIRTLAERAQEGAENPEDKARLRRILERKFLIQSPAPAQPKKERAAPWNLRMRRMERALSLLTESQCQIVLGLAKSMTRQEKGGRKTDPKPDSQGPK